MSLFNLKGHEISAACLADLNRVFVESGSNAALARSVEFGQDYTVAEFWQVMRRDPDTGQPKAYEYEQMTPQVREVLKATLDFGGVDAALAQAKSFGFPSVETLLRAALESKKT